LVLIQAAKYIVSLRAHASLFVTNERTVTAARYLLSVLTHEAPNNEEENKKLPLDKRKAPNSNALNITLPN
jgi:hypothetical protein